MPPKAKTRSAGSKDSTATIGFEAIIRKEHADTIRRDLHPDLRADYVLVKSKAAAPKPGFRDRRRETLFIDARKMGRRVSRMNCELTEEGIDYKVASTSL